MICFSSSFYLLIVWSLSDILEHWGLQSLRQVAARCRWETQGCDEHCVELLPSHADSWPRNKLASRPSISHRGYGEEWTLRHLLYNAVQRWNTYLWPGRGFFSFHILCFLSLTNMGGRGRHPLIILYEYIDLYSGRTKTFFFYYLF